MTQKKLPFILKKNFLSIFSIGWKTILFGVWVLFSNTTKSSAQTCVISNQSVTVSNTILGCGTTNATISLGNSEDNLIYLLKNNTTNLVVDKQFGTGSSIDFTTGDLTNTTVYSIIGAQQDSGLSFDGVDDYIYSTNQFNYNDGTWEAWVKKDDWEDHHNDILFGNGINTTTNGCFYVSLHPAGLHFRYGGTSEGGNGYVISAVTQSFSPGSWHHLAASWHYTGAVTTLKLYIDGNEVATSYINLVFSGSSPETYLGGGGSFTDFFGTGTMNDVRIWSFAKVETQVIASMNNCLVGNETNLLGNWKLTDGTGSVAVENSIGNSGGSNDGQLMNFNTSSCWTTGGVYCSCKQTMTQTATVNVKPKPLAPIVASSFTRCGGGTAIIHPISGGPNFAWVANGSNNLTDGCSGFPLGVTGGYQGNGSGSGSGSGSSGSNDPIINSGDYTTSFLDEDFAYSYTVYSVDYVNGNPCYSDASFSFCILVASECITKTIAPSLSNSIQLFPNPSNGEVELSFDVNTTTDVSIKIFNQTGQVVFVDNRQRLNGQYLSKLDLHTLLKGLYYVSITTEEGVVGKPLLIE